MMASRTALPVARPLVAILAVILANPIASSLVCVGGNACRTYGRSPLGGDGLGRRVFTRGSGDRSRQTGSGLDVLVQVEHVVGIVLSLDLNKPCVVCIVVGWSSPLIIVGCKMNVATLFRMRRDRIVVIPHPPDVAFVIRPGPATSQQAPWRSWNRGARRQSRPIQCDGRLHRSARCGRLSLRPAPWAHAPNAPRSPRR